MSAKLVSHMQAISAKGRAAAGPGAGRGVKMASPRQHKAGTIWCCSHGHGVLVSIAFLAHFAISHTNARGERETAPSGSLSTNAPFIVHLLNPPWIQEVLFVSSELHIAGEKQIWINMTNRAAIRPDGMFFETLTAPPFGPKPIPGLNRVFGISDQFYWGADPSSRVLSIIPRETQHNNDQPPLSTIYIQNDIQYLRHFGFPALQANTFTLGNENQFKALSVDGHVISGKIIECLQDKPVKLFYHIEKETLIHFTIQYGYENDISPLPNYFSFREIRNNRPFRDLTNRILQIKWGVDNSILQGFLPSMFYTNLSIFTHVEAWSNGVRFIVSPSGQMRAITDDAPTYPNTQTSSRLLVFALFSLAGVVIFMLMITRRQRIHNNASALKE